MSNTFKIVAHPIAKELFSGQMIEDVGALKDAFVRTEMDKENAREAEAKARMRAAINARTIELN